MPQEQAEGDNQDEIYPDYSNIDSNPLVAYKEQDYKNTEMYPHNESTQRNDFKRTSFSPKTIGRKENTS